MNQCRTCLDGISCQICKDKYYFKENNCLPCQDKCAACITEDYLNCTICVGKNRNPENFCYCNKYFKDPLDIRLIQDCD
jgi:hypothetical protein